MKHLIRTLIFLMMVAAAFPAAAESWPHERDGFVLGFNIGGGSATAKPNEGEESSGGGGAAAFRFGWAFSNQFLVGYEGTGWYGNTDLDADLNLNSNKLNFTWYPGARGWFLRTGFGWGSAELTGGLFGATVTVSESGGAFGLGGGHEWRLTRKFALGVAVDYNKVGLEDIDFDFVNFTAQLNWYF